MRDVSAPLSRDDAESIKEALLRSLGPVHDPINIAKELIEAFDAIEAATRPVTNPSGAPR